MKFSIVAKQHNFEGHSFMGLTARGKYFFSIDGKTDVKNLAEADKDELFVVKFTKTTPVAIPTANAIYEVEIPESASMWKDTREGIKRATIWVKCEEGAVKFTKKKDLPDLPF